MDINFDFLVTPTDETDTGGSPPLDYVGPNIDSAAKMTPKKFAQAVLEVFDRLGGASWLLTEAQADPKAFLGLLQRLIPKSIQLDDLQGVQINLIDQFGNRVEIATGSGKSSPQLETATGGNPAERSPSCDSPAEQSSPQLETPALPTKLPSIAIKDIF